MSDEMPQLEMRTLLYDKMKPSNIYMPLSATRAEVPGSTKLI